MKDQDSPFVLRLCSRRSSVDHRWNLPREEREKEKEEIAEGGLCSENTTLSPAGNNISPGEGVTSASLRPRHARCSLLPLWDFTADAHIIRFLRVARDEQKPSRFLFFHFFPGCLFAERKRNITSGACSYTFHRFFQSEFLAKDEKRSCFLETWKLLSLSLISLRRWVSYPLHAAFIFLTVSLSFLREGILVKTNKSNFNEPV